ncbi:Type III restriction protein res subunit [groundwater metagenome]|uniref:Type III restriction protein res subunit n=1 Tax=groundwater metagenome TaxID=717931 RepID=A0A098EAS4_9ZZZZ
MTDEEKQNPLLYQKIAEQISYESLPSEWTNLNLDTFSENIYLFDYQQDALKNAIKILHYYFESLEKFQNEENELTNIERKKKFFNEIKRGEEDLLETLGITNKKNKLLFGKIKQYYEIIQKNSYEKIHFLHFVNRMCFWMATGSGKTLVLIKLIDVLDKLKQRNLIPDNDILILTSREDLVDQLKKHIEKFNEKAERKIKVWDLTEYNNVKMGGVITSGKYTSGEINIFVYRSDLISEETKTKLLGFEDIENNGKWYILLDEAHKGDKEDSKKQILYSTLTRNCFMFNFSATFTDTWDIVTTVYNFNLERFIERGYGKNVYLSHQEMDALAEKTDFNDKDKQKIVLKSLILLTLSKQAKQSIDKQSDEKYYHNPLLVSLVNSVNTEQSDLQIFFEEIEKITNGDIDEEIFKQSKNELYQELLDNSGYVFGTECLNVKEENIKKIKIKDILEHVFNSSSFGNIEVIKIPRNKQEIIFKLKTSDRPFALLKIGDISNWLKEKLSNYEINESYDNESYFRAISQDSNPINILMGSRAFYEGWDSNRPNVMLFINIGKGDAKKYITQSIGRGVRIEPIKGKRKRLLPLKRENDSIAKEIYPAIKEEDVSLIETLFVFGTNKENLQHILDSIKHEKESSGGLIELQENEEIKGKTLLIPVYKDKECVPLDHLPKFRGNVKILNDFMQWVGDERIIYSIFSYKSNVNPKTIQKVNNFLKNEKNFNNSNQSGSVYFQIENLMSHVNIISKDIDGFKQLTDEIVHFKRIEVALEKANLEKLKKLIEKVKIYKDPLKEKEIFKKKFSDNEINLDDYTAQIEKLSKMSNEEEFFYNNISLKIKHLPNHYYIPILISESEKIDYINHIIKIDGERIFIKNLEKYIEKPDNSLKQFDWWMFCKLDEHVDKVYIPYYNREHNKPGNFYPDFIFWLKKGENYFIIFVDPKGTKHTDYEYKVDGYKTIFEENDNTKQFLSDGLKIRVRLFLFTEDINKLSEGYKKYWFDNFENLINIFKI